MDALSQLIEPFVSNAANPFTDGVCREGLTRAARSLARAYRDGSDVAAREDMALAALFGGIALANVDVTRLEFHLLRLANEPGDLVIGQTRESWSAQ